MYQNEDEKRTRSAVVSHFIAHIISSVDCNIVDGTYIQIDGKTRVTTIIIIFIIPIVETRSVGISGNVPRREFTDLYGIFALRYLQCLDGFQVLERSVGQRLQIVIVER